jgi:hypothetical protein
MSLPLPGVETVSLAARTAALAPAGPYPVVDVVETRQLGLADGQVVRPTVEVRNERLVLVLDGRLIEWPASTQARAAAMPVAWQVRLLASGSAQLLPLLTREGSVSAPSVPQPLTAALAREVLTAERIPDRIACLLVRPAGWGAWLSLLSGPRPMSAALPQPAAPSPAAVPGLRLPSLGLLDAQGLREAVLRSGLFAEAGLASAAPAAVAGDVKLALQAWWRRLGAGTPAGMQVSEALDDIEAAQLQALASRADGGLSFSLVLGFRDAAPVALKISRDEPENGRQSTDDRRGWSVDIHTRSDRWGPLWLHTRIEADDRVALVMWAERDDLCAAARDDGARLSQILAEQGLHLERFQVILGPRADASVSGTPPANGSVLDLKA